MSSNVTITSLPVTVDGVTFRLAEHADKPAILDGWFSTFVPDEAMCQAMQWKDGRPQTVEEVLSDILDEGCTPVAVDAHGAVLGFFCCHICHPGEEKPTLQDLHVQFAGAHVFACLIDVWCGTTSQSKTLRTRKLATLAYSFIGRTGCTSRTAK